MKIVIISDTHGWHDDVVLPEGEVLIHCGDMLDGFSRGGVPVGEVDIGLVPNLLKRFCAQVAITIVSLNAAIKREILSFPMPRSSWTKVLYTKACVFGRRPGFPTWKGGRFISSTVLWRSTGQKFQRERMYSLRTPLLAA